MSLRGRPRLVGAALALLLLEAIGTARGAPPPSRRSRVFDAQPTVYGERGVLDGLAVPGSPVPWPSAGSWRTRPLTISPELDLAEPPTLVPQQAPPAPAPAGPSSGTVAIPLPPRRPPGLGGLAPLDADGTGFAAGSNCFAQLRAAGTTFVPASQQGGNPGCSIDAPVQVSAIAERNAPGGSISLTDRPVISCRMAVRFGEWLRAVAPALGSSRNAALVSITTGPGWECRGRNRQSGGRLSAHANGDALDINTFFFANRARLPVQGGGGDPAFHAARMAACSHFTTVLGPGSAFHDSHLHLDIMTHGRYGYRLCR